MSVQHVVLFRFEPELDEGGEEALFAQLRAWPEQIGLFRMLHLAKPLPTGRNLGYHYLLSLVVEDDAALQVYQEHPVHRRFVEWMIRHGGSILSFDYSPEDATIVPAPSQELRS